MAGPHQLRLVVFAVGGAAVALPLELLLEVVPFAPPTAAAPAGWLGRRRWRGRELPVAHAAQLLGLPARKRPASTLVLSTPAGQAGLAVDAVEGATPVPADAVEPLPETARGGYAELVAGVAARSVARSEDSDDQPAPLIILDGRRVAALLSASLQPDLRPLPLQALASAPPTGAGHHLPTGGPNDDYFRGGLVLEIEVPGPSGPQALALPLARVRAVGARPATSPLPRGRLPLDGLASWQGRFIPALTLAERLGVANGAEHCDRSVIADAADRAGAPLAALAVARFGEILEVPASTLRPPDGEGPVPTRFLHSVASRHDGDLPILDLRSVLTAA